MNSQALLDSHCKVSHKRYFEELAIRLSCGLFTEEVGTRKDVRDVFLPFRLLKGRQLFLEVTCIMPTCTWSGLPHMSADGPFKLGLIPDLFVLLWEIEKS